MSNTYEFQPNSVPRLREAFEKLREEIEAMPDDEFATINVDVLTAATTVMGALSEITALRPRFVAELPLLDITQLDKLEDYALASAHAHTQYLGADTLTETIPQLSEDAVKVREFLVSDASALAKRGVLNSAKLLELKGTNGYRNTASDVLTLAGMLRDNWAKVSSKTCVSLDELDRAEALGYQLLNAIGFREHGSVAVAAAARARQRSYTLLAKAYNQVRRAVCFLRWDEGDADEVAPSLYAGRGGRKRVRSELAAVAAPAAAVRAAIPALSPVVAATVTTTIPAGLPGADPFIH